MAELFLAPLVAAIVAAAVAVVQQWWQLRRLTAAEAEVRRTLEEAGHLFDVTVDEKAWWPAFATVPTEVWERDSATLFRRFKREEWETVDKAFARLRLLNGWAGERRALAAQLAGQAGERPAISNPLVPFEAGEVASPAIKHARAEVTSALDALSAGARARKRRWRKSLVTVVGATLIAAFAIGIAVAGFIRYTGPNHVSDEDVARSLRAALPTQISDVVTCEPRGKSTVEWRCATADLEGSSCPQAEGTGGSTAAVVRALAAAQKTETCKCKAENDYDVIVDGLDRFMAKLVKATPLKGATKLPTDGPSTVAGTVN